MSDLIERLQKVCVHTEATCPECATDRRLALDEIERLRRELAEAREWLRDPQWGTWPYMEGSAIYDDEADALDDIDAFPAEKEGER